MQPDRRAVTKEEGTHQVDRYAHRVIKGGVGHNLPQEAPQAFAKAVVDVDGF